MTHDDLVGWVWRAYDRGCSEAELLVLADALDEHDLTEHADRLRTHARCTVHSGAPSGCGVLFTTWSRL